jgi:hypothetical protein
MISSDAIPQILAAFGTSPLTLIWLIMIRLIQEMLAELA